MAEVEVLIHCFYMPLGLKEGRPILNLRWPLIPMPGPEVREIYGDLRFNLGSTNTVLIRNGGGNIIVDPEASVRSLEVIRGLRPNLVVPGHDAPFTLHGEG